MKIKPESEISCHITLTSIKVVYSTLDIFTTVVSARGRITHKVKLVVGLPTPQANILAAALTWLSRLHQRKVASCKNQGNCQVWPVAITTRVMSLLNTGETVK